MTEGQRNHLGVLLWGKTGENGLPDLPDLHYFHFLHLPAPENVDVVSKIKQHILSIEPLSNKVEENPMILNAALASKAVVHIPHESKGIVEWNWDETKGVMG